MEAIIQQQTDLINIIRERLEKVEGTVSEQADKINKLKRKIKVIKKKRRPSITKSKQGSDSDDDEESV